MFLLEKRYKKKFIALISIKHQNSLAYKKVDIFRKHTGVVKF